MLAAGEALEHHVPCPAELPHSDFGRIVGAHHPLLDLVEIIADRIHGRLVLCAGGDGEPSEIFLAFDVAGLGARGFGQQIVLLGLGNLLEGVAEALDRQ